ncbi:MAG: hypothetical protein CMG05_00680 [Candidatus Marinimicrobia bacterium]|nr:hypothetical protein [Candidatus Neomarinimicrobiota bacterium]
MKNKMSIYYKIKICISFLIIGLFFQSNTILFGNYIATGSFGAATIDGKIYNQISFRPEITYNKLGIGLDVNIYIDANGEIYSKNWMFNNLDTSLETIMDKIYYLRWGNRNDDFYFRAGSLPSITLGYGALVERYSNSLEYPQVKKLGLNLIAGNDKVKFEYVHSDFKSTPGLIALETKFNLSSRSNVFITLAHDINQLSRLDEIPSNRSESDWIDWCQELEQVLELNLECSSTYNLIENQSPYEGKNPISGISIGADYVLSDKISVYSEWAQLIGKTDNDQNLGNGIIFPGLSYRFKNGKFNLEGRHILSNNFMFNYWDRSYDIQRTINSSNNFNNNDFYTKESSLNQYETMNGIYSYFSYDILRIMNFLVGYQYLIKDVNTYKSFSSSINVNPNLITKVKKIEFFYQNNNVTNPFKLGLSSIHGYDIGVEASDRMTITYQSRTTYRLGENGEFEPIRIMQLDTQFDF